MAFIPAVNTARVTIHMSMFFQTVQNVLHVRKNTAWSAPELVTLCNDVIEWWNDHLAANLSTDIQLLAVQARDMTIADGLGVQVSAPAGSGGDVVNPALPGNVTIAIKHVTGFTGRNRAGRTYVAGLPENAVGGNSILEAQRANLVSAFEALRGAMVAADQEMVVASFHDGTALVPLPNGETRRRPVARATALLTPVLSFAADPLLDSQSRRLNGRGL